MARPSIENIRGVGDFAEVYRWNLIFEKFPSAIAAPDTQDLNIRCESTELPKGTIQKAEIDIRGHKVFQPSIITYNSPLTFTFVETVDNLVHTFLRNWREACYAVRTGVGQTKEACEARVRLERLNRQDEAIWFYTLVGAFYEDSEPGGTLDGVTPDLLKPQLILSFDFFDDGAV